MSTPAVPSPPADPTVDTEVVQMTGTERRSRHRRTVILLVLVVFASTMVMTACMVNQTALDPVDRLDPSITFDHVPTIARVRYGPDPQHHLDVHLPTGDVLGTVIWFHSGGWGSGDQVNVDALVGSLLVRGYAIVTADYRFVPDVRAPEIAADADRVVRYVRAHRAEWGAPDGPVILAGGSAGGHIALLAASAPGVFAGRDLPEDLRAQDPHVDGVISFVGPSDLGWYLTGGVFGQEMIENFLGCSSPVAPFLPLQPCEPGQAAAFSPLAWASFASFIHATLPPAFLAYGEEDGLVPPSSQGTPLALDWQRSAGAEWTWYALVQGEGHNLTYGVNRTAFDEWVRRVTERPHT
jgi:acetyl esterase/lipase